MQVMLAGALPMLKAAIDELGRSGPDGVDRFLDGVICLVADLRSDDAPRLLILNGLTTGDGRKVYANPTGIAEFGQPVGEPNPLGRTLGMREVDPGSVAALESAGTQGDT